MGPLSGIGQFLTLKRFKNAGLDASGRLSGRVSGRASGRLSGRHVGPSNLSWPEGGKRVDQTEPQNSHQQTIQTDTNFWVEITKQDPEGMSICEQHTCNIITKVLSYTCVRLHPQFSFISGQPQAQTRVSKLLDGTESIREILKNHGWLWEPLLH